MRGLRVVSCGWNGYGQLGVGSLDFRDGACDVDVVGAVVQLACGGHHFQGFTLARTEGGEVLVWGDNSVGQLGSSDKKPALAPRRVELPGRAVWVACGTQHAVVVLEDGSVLGWGDNSFGQLPQHAAPSSEDDRAVSAACGDAHTLLLTKGGRVIGFGSDELGQLGAGKVIADACAVACGQAHSLVVLRNGSVLACGANNTAQLGLPGADCVVKQPTRVPGLPQSVVWVSGGIGHSIAVTREGECFGWGSNEHGQLGLDAEEKPMCPLAVSVAQNVARGVAGGHHTLLVRRDGSLWSDGCKSEGQRAFEASGGVREAAASETHSVFVVEM
jgi:alpha-tubulin suppressor-like RCC1 family protein